MKGARSKGEFSRLDCQVRPGIQGASAFRHFLAKLLPRANSIYYSYEIGNISTSYPWDDSKKSEGRQFLNLTFGSLISEQITYNLVVKVVLPEGSKDLLVSTPSPVKQGQEAHLSRRKNMNVRIATIMNGLVLVGVAVGFVLLRIEASLEEAD
ncbi:hypothetical protein K2173_002313 [Erythroxylum novogranatense]|uniref:Dolichyl-diphosphooligosaccharide--protein glycosyltransferase subunit 1 n=1 Tax=Erythroxylum novogranatense TaxID=1862640 RepID=A0AAV8TAZ5_9ROSI|nr:hypothetical protein K2173_002313 [Erythroxylum novogranatense]